MYGRKRSFSSLGSQQIYLWNRYSDKINQFRVINTAEYTEDISKNFQKFVLELGNSCVGDEKLFHYTGLTKDIRLVVSKPGRVGLWFYAVCSIRYGKAIYAPYQDGSWEGGFTSVECRRYLDRYH